MNKKIAVILSIAIFFGSVLAVASEASRLEVFFDKENVGVVADDDLSLRLFVDFYNNFNHPQYGAVAKKMSKLYNDANFSFNWVAQVNRQDRLTFIQFIDTSCADEFFDAISTLFILRFNDQLKVTQLLEVSTHILKNGQIAFSSDGFDEQLEEILRNRCHEKTNFISSANSFSR